MTTRRTRPLARPQLHQLEARDVPATFYVDPTLAGSTDGSTQTFNAGQPNQVPGLIYGSSSSTPGAVLFSNFTDATTAALGSAGADVVLLANGTIPIDNTASGSISLGGDDITLIGSGSGVTTLKPLADTAGEQFGVIESVGAGSVFRAINLAFDGTGFQVGNAFYLESAAAYFGNVVVRNAQFGTNLGIGVAAAVGSDVIVDAAQFAAYGRIGLSYANSTGQVTGSTFTGRGLTVGDVVNYGVQVTGGSTVSVKQSTFTAHQATSLAGESSAGIWLYQDGGSPTATVANNTFASNAVGVLVGFQRANDNATATITRNDFLTSNTYGVVAQNNTLVNATRNYWGSARGPSDEFGGNPGGTGSKVSDQVNYQHWLTRPFAQGEPAVAFAASSTGALPAYLLNQTGAVLRSVSGTLGGFTGEVRSASGDLTGDGVPDLAVSVGAGTNPLVQVYDGATGALIRNFYAYDPFFTGGVYVAFGDVNGDGRADIITGAGAGGAPHVKVFDALNGSEVASFYAYDVSFTGGVRVGSGDVNNDGKADIVTGAGPGATPHVKVFVAGATSIGLPPLAGGSTAFALAQSFFAFDPGFGGGVFVSLADVTGDGRADVIVGAGAANPHVRVYKSNLDGTQGPVVGSFLLSDPAGFSGGIRVSARDLDDDGCADLILALGVGGDTKIRLVNAASIGAFSPPLGFLGSPGLYPGTPGVYVG